MTAKPQAPQTDTARDFLLEIGCEELPAAACRAALAQAPGLTRAAFERHLIDIKDSPLRIWVTPRRIAMLLEGVPEKPEPREALKRGPKAELAFDESGAPTRAAEGFARANGVSVGDLEVRDFEGKRFVYSVKKSMVSHSTGDLIESDILLEILSGFSFDKSMVWTPSKFAFPRPIRWFVLKYGDADLSPGRDIYPGSGLSALFGCETRGHRFLGEHRISVETPAAYLDLLAENHVIADQEERRRIILEGLATEAGKLGGRFIDPAGELEEVIYLVENPGVFAGGFAEEHLRLPDRVLITCMQSHQRYFPLADEEGALMPHFLYVMNGDPAAAPGITGGNERVLEGRIEDAEFSFEQDLKMGIEVMAANLGNVVFHRKLGSLADKTARLESLVGLISEMNGLADEIRRTAEVAARLAKADQVSTMVQEFPDLEGYIGSVYANLESYNSDICAAIEEQYLPGFAGGSLPRTAAGAVMSIVDKVDNLVGAFSVSELPTGSRDPYGLRRAAVGMAEISASFGFDFDLQGLLRFAHELFITQKAEVDRDVAVVTRAAEFVMDRVQQRLIEGGTPVEIVEAARAAKPAGTMRLMELVAALDAFRLQPGFEDLHTAYFRSSKIAAKAEGEPGGIEVDESLFKSGAETELKRTLDELEPEIGRLIESRAYGEALKLAAGARPVVDRFFDEVLVMAEDERVRKNRLALVSRTAAILLSLGDPVRVAAAPAPESGT